MPTKLTDHESVEKIVSEMTPEEKARMRGSAEQSQSLRKSTELKCRAVIFWKSWLKERKPPER